MPFADNARSPAASRVAGTLAPHPGSASNFQRPAPAVVVRRQGPMPLTVLLFGGGPLVGDGLPDHDHGIAGRLADMLASRLARGVEVHVMVEPEPLCQDAVDGLIGLQVDRYDAVVVVLGTITAATSAETHSHWAAELERVLRTGAHPEAPVCVFGAAATVSHPQTLSGRRRELLLHAQSHAVEQAASRAGRVGVQTLVTPVRFPSTGRSFDHSSYETWGDQIGQAITRRLPQTHIDHTTAPAPPAVEALRQHALDGLDLARADNTTLERIVRTAKDAYSSAGAAINIIDRTHQWSRISEPVFGPIPRQDAFCTHAIESDESMLVNDTQLDHRTSGSPLSHGPDAVRFYAGHPIRTPDGHRIGTLCVFGDTPRAMRESELELLRHLAGLVEQELWSVPLRTHHAP